jgi:hypothetical protein
VVSGSCTSDGVLAAINQLVALPLAFGGALHGLEKRMLLRHHRTSDSVAARPARITVSVTRAGSVGMNAMPHPPGNSSSMAPHSVASASSAMERWWRSCGFRPLRNSVPIDEATAVARLRAARPTARPVSFFRAVGGFTSTFSESGNPVVALPAGRSTGSLPIGIDVVGRGWTDNGWLPMGPFWTNSSTGTLPT